jgi:hypothetical protein
VITATFPWILPIAFLLRANSRAVFDVARKFSIAMIQPSRVAGGRMQNAYQQLYTVQVAPLPN